MREPFLGIVVFSAVETAAVAVWGAILKVGAGLPAEVQALAIGVLFAGYVIEHVIAFNVGQDRPYLSWPRRKER